MNAFSIFYAHLLRYFMTVLQVQISLLNWWRALSGHGWTADHTWANPTYISPPRPRGFELPTFPSQLHTCAPAAPRVIPVNPRITCSPASAFDSLSWLDLHHLLRPTSPAAAAAAAAAVTRFPHVVVGNTHAPGISNTALTRISWTSSVFTNRKKKSQRWV